MSNIIVQVPMGDCCLCREPLSNGKNTVTIREKGARKSMNTANYEMIHYVLSLDRHCIKIADESIPI